MVENVSVMHSEITHDLYPVKSIIYLSMYLSIVRDAGLNRILGSHHGNMPI